MSHQRNISLRPHDLWGTLGKDSSKSSGTETAPSLTPESQSKGNTTAGPSKAMSTQAVTQSASAPGQLTDFVIERNRLYDELKQQYDEELAAKPKPEIKITFIPEPGKKTQLDGKAWETTPGKLLRDVPKERAGKIVVAQVDGKEWDLDRPLEADCEVSYLTFDDPKGRDVFWHSAAHVLGECAEHQYGCFLSHGPPTPLGFFYDMFIPAQEKLGQPRPEQKSSNGLDSAADKTQQVKQDEWPALENKYKKFVKDKQQFERLVVSKENLKKMFWYSKYKTYYIDKFIPDGESSTVYRNGDLVDLCQGPHIQNTRKIESFKVMKSSSAKFMGEENGEDLQRVHGVAFPTKQGLKDWEKYLEEAAKRNHQLIGKEQKLFSFSELSPGSPFLKPHGVRIFNALQNMIREQYKIREYQEVQTPNMYNVDLWKTSGHWQHYQDDMFRVVVKSDAAEPMPLADQKPDGKPIADPKKEDKDKGVFALKPMNCPGHCLLFGQEERSYRELPWRVADFGVLHRNEASGALSGLTRVRKFQQDDTHVFCTKEQIMDEIADLFNFMDEVYALFGFPFKLKLSTRPEGFMGKIEEWDDAEAQLTQALNNFRGSDWEINPGDGAFYGPKIDITIQDALQREYQCATIQLDFQGPQNFKLEYRAGKVQDEITDASAEKDPNAPKRGMERPVMIHRAIIGSFERFIAILCEHFAGKWPFWLSPRQVMVIPVMKGAEDYVREIRRKLILDDIYADMDLSGETLQKKIRAAQIAQYNFIFVVGAKEQESRTVNIRNRDDPSTQKMGKLIPLDKAFSRLTELRKERRLKNEINMEE